MCVADLLQTASATQRGLRRLETDCGGREEEASHRLAIASSLGRVRVAPGVATGARTDEYTTCVAGQSPSSQPSPFHFHTTLQEFTMSEGTYTALDGRQVTVRRTGSGRYLLTYTDGTVVSV